MRASSSTTRTARRSADAARASRFERRRMTGREPYGHTRFLRQRSRDREPTIPRANKDPMPVSYFALFNLEPRFALPVEQLELAYRALAAQVHPDRHAQSSSAARREAQMLAANANEAYRTLRKPLLRARHLLALGGVTSDDDQTSVSRVFLTEQMEWRETLGRAHAARDAAALHQ